MKTFLPRFSIGKKLAAGGLACMLPLALLVYFTVSELGVRIDSTAREMDGARYLPAFHRLLLLLPRYHSAAQETDRERLAARIDGLIAELHQRRLPQRPGSEAAEAFARKLEAFSAQWRARAGEKQMYETVRYLLRQVGDASDLILDPDLDSYYLMDAALLTAPPMAERLAALYLSAHGEAADSVLEQMALLAQNDGTHLIASAQAALREDKNFYGVRSGLQQALPPFIARLEENLQSLTEARSHPKIRAAAHETLLAGGLLAQEASRQLEELLEVRIAHLKTRRLTALVLTGFALLGAFALMYLTCRSVTRTLRTSVEIAAEIGRGQVSAAKQALSGTPGNPGETWADEVWQLCRAMERMTEQLDGLVAQVRDAGSRVGSSSSQIAAATCQLEAAVSEQACSAQQVNSTVREISSSTVELTKNLAEAADSVSDTARLAGQGQAGLTQIDGVMHSVLQSAAELSGKLQHAKEKTGNIDQVVTTITKVANQINLLSLNAAIEADKAGEYGVGFSVVAQEIQRLADQTAASVIEIEEIVTGMQLAVDEASHTTDGFVSLAGSGGETVRHISSSLQTLIEQVHQLDPRFRAIAEGMHCQTEAAVQITAALDQLNQVARQTMEAVSGFKDITGELTQTVDGLRERVAFFQ